MKRLIFAFVFFLNLANVSFAQLKFEPVEITTDTKMLLVKGSFDQSDQTEEFLAAVRLYHPLGITFDSPGGNIDSAMKLGRTIRHLRLATVQFRNFQCASACSLAFIGGTKRFAEAGSIGVHQGSFANIKHLDGAAAVSSIQYATALTIGYFNEMGVDPKLLEISLKYRPDDIRYLSSSEMDELNVITSDFEFEPDEPIETNHGQEGTDLAKVEEPKNAIAPSLFDIPKVTSGRIRHPKGIATLLSKPNFKEGIAIAKLTNGTKVKVIGDKDRWYQISEGNNVGYVHHTWLKADQYEDFGFDQKFIQIKSFETYVEAKSFVEQSNGPISAHLATNGWFAIAIDSTFDPERAINILKELKRQNAVPDDSFVTFGNTYVRKVCCK